MKVQSKILGIVSLVLLLFLIVIYFVSANLLINNSLELEKRLLELNCRRVLQNYHEEGKSLAIITQDWAAWDDTYQFVQDLNSAYSKSNLTDNLLADLEIHLFAIVDTNFKTIYARKTADIEMPTREFDLEADSFFSCHLERLKQRGLNPDTNYCLLPSQPDPLLVVVEPIITSDNSGTPRGFLLMGHFLDHRRISFWSHKLQLTIKLQTSSQDACESIKQCQDTLFMHEDGFGACILSRDSVMGYAVLSDSDKNFRCFARFFDSRTVYLQACYNVRYLMVILLICGIFFLLIQWVLLQRFVLTKIIKIQEELDYREFIKKNPAIALQKGKVEFTRFIETMNRHLDNSDSEPDKKQCE